MKNKKKEVFNVRVVRSSSGTFSYEPTYPMIRLADYRKSKGYSQWIQASKRDRTRLRKQLLTNNVLKK